MHVGERARAARAQREARRSKSSKPEKSKSKSKASSARSESDRVYAFCFFFLLVCVLARSRCCALTSLSDLLARGGRMRVGAGHGTRKSGTARKEAGPVPPSLCFCPCALFTVGPVANDAGPSSGNHDHGPPPPARPRQAKMTRLLPSPIDGCSLLLTTYDR